MPSETPMHPLQAMVDGMSAAWQKERQATGMTLGSLISKLEAMPQDAEVIGLGDLDSYRGYYCDLAFEPEPSARPVSAVLAECRAAMGKVFQGYKGGDFLMGETTPLWVASYGSCGDRLLGLTDTTPHAPILGADDE